MHPKPDLTTCTSRQRNRAKPPRNLVLGLKKWIGHVRCEKTRRNFGSTMWCILCRPGHPPGRVGFGSGQKKPGVFSSGPCPTRPGGRAVKLSPHPTRQPVGSGRVRVGSGRAYVKCRVPSGFSGFGSKFLARARPVSHTGSKILTRARPSNSSGRVGSGYFRAGWVGSVGSGSPCPGLLGTTLAAVFRFMEYAWDCSVFPIASTSSYCV